MNTSMAAVAQRGPSPSSPPTMSLDNATKGKIIVRQAESPEDLASITALFNAYTDWLGIDLSFQSYAAELASLPGAYARPLGSLLLAVDDTGTALGCFAVRRLPYNNPEGELCEAKRLFVSPEGRGKGIGQVLVEAGVAAARDAGYQEMKLDTLASMGSAQRLYKRFGFTETEAYYSNPHEGTIYMSLKLGNDKA